MEKAGGRVIKEVKRRIITLSICIMQNGLTYKQR
jgi:hypothetical protein